MVSWFGLPEDTALGRSANPFRITPMVKVWPDVNAYSSSADLMDAAQFLQKEKSQKIIDYLKKGYTHNEISKIFRCSPSTIQKVKGMVEG